MHFWISFVNCFSFKVFIKLNEFQPIIQAKGSGRIKCKSKPAMKSKEILNTASVYKIGLN